MTQYVENECNLRETSIAQRDTSPKAQPSTDCTRNVFVYYLLQTTPFFALVVCRIHNEDHPRAAEVNDEFGRCGGACCSFYPTVYLNSRR